MQNTASVPIRRDEDIERQLRSDLAAAFRLAAGFNWHESVGNRGLSERQALLDESALAALLNHEGERAAPAG